MEAIKNDKLTNQEIIERVRNAKKGRYTHLTKVKPLGNGIVKESEMVIRLGVNYQNLSMNEGRVTGGLKWGHWVEGLENLVLEHKGQYYLRVTIIYLRDLMCGSMNIILKSLRNKIKEEEE